MKWWTIFSGMICDYGWLDHYGPPYEHYSAYCNCGASSTTWIIIGICLVRFVFEFSKIWMLFHEIACQLMFFWQNCKIFFNKGVGFFVIVGVVMCLMMRNPGGKAGSGGPAEMNNTLKKSKKTAKINEISLKTMKICPFSLQISKYNFFEVLHRRSSRDLGGGWRRRTVHRKCRWHLGLQYRSQPAGDLLIVWSPSTISNLKKLILNCNSFLFSVAAINDLSIINIQIYLGSNSIYSF